MHTFRLMTAAALLPVFAAAQAAAPAAKQTFKLIYASTDQDANEIMTSVRTIADIGKVAIDNPRQFTAEGTADQLRTADWIVRQLDIPPAATGGNDVLRGIADTHGEDTARVFFLPPTLTVQEYLALSRWRRLGYQLYRNPIVMFVLGPAYLFIIQHRLPIGMMRGGWQPWISTMATNGGIALLIVGMMWLVGVGPFLLVHLPITMLAASIGVWLFFVQHQFEETFWAEAPAWTLHEAALHGSSHYDLPPVLRWITANIGVHHVHHLSSRIPYYRLPRVLNDHPELKDVGRLTLLQSLACVRLVLWDESNRRLISFRDLRRSRRAAAPAG